MSTSPKPSVPDQVDVPVMIERPNLLKERTGGSLDPALATRAETAVQSLAVDFPKWIAETVERLVQTRAQLSNQPLQGQARSTLYIPALEAKSLGETYGYPLVTRFAHSLCRLLARLPEQMPAPHALVDAHIDAIKASLQLPPSQGAQDPIATKLVTEIEAQVNAVLAKAGA
jgi:hypothetical protein